MLYAPFLFTVKESSFVEGLSLFSNIDEFCKYFEKNFTIFYKNALLIFFNHV